MLSLTTQANLKEEDTAPGAATSTILNLRKRYDLFIYLYPMEFVLDVFFYYLILLLQSAGIQREPCIMPGICQIFLSLIQWFYVYIQIILADIMYFEEFI